MTTFNDLLNGAANPFKTTVSGAKYPVNKTLLPGHYRYKINGAPGVKYGLWFDDRYVGYVYEGEIEFRLTATITINDVVIKSLDSNLPISLTKLERGEVYTEYSPAPEDGYGMDLQDGAWHVESTGGSVVNKYYSQSVFPTGVEVSSSVEVHPFLDLRISNNYYSQVPTTKERSTVSFSSTSTGVGYIGLQFQTLEADEPLDFIAKEPIITEGKITDYRLVDSNIINQGNTPSKPIIKITRFTSNSAELRMIVGNRQMIYTWPQGEQYVEYDNRTGYSFYEGQRRDRHWHIDMEPFTLNPGSTKVVKETAYTTEVHVKKESRWR